MADAIRDDQGRRGVQQVPEDYIPGHHVLKQIQDLTGMEERACGTDNAARTEAGSSPRNLIDYMAGMVALTDEKFTDDEKPVHMRHRGNFDAVTAVQRRGKKGKVMTVVKRTALLAADPELDREWEEQKGLQNTQRCDTTLAHVRLIPVTSVHN